MSSSSLCEPNDNSNSSNNDLESLFQPPCTGHGPGFQLSSWSSGSSSDSKRSTTRNGRSWKRRESLPFAIVDNDVTTLDTDEDDDDDDDDDDSMSCDWSMESSCGDEVEDDDNDDDNVVTDAASFLPSPPRTPERQRRGQPARRVHFSECNLVRCYLKPEIADLPLLYYSAHELQKIIDEYVEEQRYAAAMICPSGAVTTTQTAT